MTDNTPVSVNKRSTPINQYARLRHAVVAFIWRIVLGFGLFLCTLQAEQLWLPEGWGTISRLIYRVPFLLIAPARLLVMPISPRVDHHWSLTHFALASFLTPFIYLAVYRLLRMAVQHWRKRDTTRQLAESDAHKMPRREFLARSAAGAVGIAVTGTGGYASLIEPSRLAVRQYTVPIANLPRELDGLRVLHISDTHYGPFTDLYPIGEMIETANALLPDLIVFTGDYVHFTPASVRPGIEILSRLRGKLGTVAVLGNHEYWEGVDACREVFGRMGIPLLDNRHVFLTATGVESAMPKQNALCLAGFADLWEDIISFESALGGVPDTMPRIVLSHNPDAAEITPPEYRVDLMFSGHTHGGQVRLPIIGTPASLSRYGEKYLGGLCQGPRFPVIVSRGFGLAMFPVRLGVPPEIGIVTLTRS